MKGGDDMGIQNGDFICELCGRRDLALSALRLRCNYGSKNDGEELELNICGNCADMAYKHIQKKKYNVNRGENN